MKDKLLIIKNKLITAKYGIKSFLSICKAFFKKLFLYFKGFNRLATPFMLAIVVLMGMCMFYQHRLHKEELEDVREESYVITEYFVAEELKSIGELNTAEYTYTIERDPPTEYRKIFNFNVPLTGKSLSVLYSGEVKVGYNIADMKPTIVGKVIFFDIPEPIIENCITKEVVKDEDNNIFNPIDADDYAKLRNGVLEEGLTNAVAKGTYETAGAELKSILNAHFEKFGYRVAFI